MKKRTKGALSAVLLSATVFSAAGTAKASVGSRTIQADYNNIKVALDGAPVDLVDVNGTPVDPFLIDGTTYLPVRAISSALGLRVGWNQEAATVELSSQTGQPLTHEEIRWFNEEFFNSDAAAKAGGRLYTDTEYYNLRNQFASVSILYNKPEEIDLSELFYMEGTEPTDQEIRDNIGMEPEDLPCMAYKLTCEEMDRLLQIHTGVPLSETRMMKNGEFRPNGSDGAFYWTHGDTNYNGEIDFLCGIKEIAADGKETVKLYHSDGGVWYCVTLSHQADGSYWFLSNQICGGLSSEDSSPKSGIETVQADYNNIQVTLNGSPVNLVDVNGTPVEPFLIGGTTYLPVRAVSSALGLGVDWNQETKTVELSSAGSQPLPGEPLTSEELRWFNEEFFNSTSSDAEERVRLSFSGEVQDKERYNLRNQFAGIGNLYDRPEDVDPSELLMKGTALTEQEMMDYTGYTDKETLRWLAPIYKLTPSELDTLLKTYTGVPLSENREVKSGKFQPDEKGGAYYWFNWKASYAGDIHFLYGTKETATDGKEIVRLCHNTGTMTGWYGCVTLSRQTDGSYWFLSNQLCRNTFSG